MTDQNSLFFAILTDIGRAKQANADALGVPWTFAQMGVGDANDTNPIPTSSQTKLINERRRAPLNQLKVDPNNPNVIIAEQVIPDSVGGWWVRELALYDAAGDMVAVANCAPTYKPLIAQGSGRTQIIRINLIVSNTANIELKIDPSVVLATREYVDLTVGAVLPPDKAPGTYRQVTINKYGIVVSGTNPTTLAGYGITDALGINGVALSARKLAAARTLNFTGAATGSASFDGSADVQITLTLANNGVVPGSYSKVQIDAKGLVIGSSALVQTDIPNLDWSKISSGKPTTLAGYGISNAYTRQETDQQINFRVTRDKITVAGLLNNEINSPYFQRESDGALCNLQTRLGYTPIQQGTGVGQLTNTVKIGWSSTGLKATVDTADLGNFWYSGNFNPADKADAATSLRVGSISRQYPVLSAPSPAASNQVGGGALQIREAQEVGGAQSDISYAPGIAFHWSGRYVRTLRMAASGDLYWGDDPVVTGATLPKSIGVGQVWQDVTAARARDVTYTNTTGRAIAVSVTSTQTTRTILQLYIDGIEVSRFISNDASIGAVGTVNAIVPPGSAYAVSSQISSVIARWSELR